MGWVEYKKAEFSFTRNCEKYDDAEYQSFADELEKAARRVTDNFHEEDDWCKKSGIFITGADCTDNSFAFYERFENIEGLVRWLRDMTSNGWELVDGETITVKVCSRSETNFYIRTEGEYDEDDIRVVQVIFDDPDDECPVEPPQEKKPKKKAEKKRKKAKGTRNVQDGD